MKTKQWLILVFTYSWSLLLTFTSVASSPVYDDLDFDPDPLTDIDVRDEPGNDVLTLNSGPTEKPEKPTNLTITTVTDTVIELSWNQRNYDALQGHNVNYKAAKNGHPEAFVRVQERLRGSGEATTNPSWPTVPYNQLDGETTKLDFRLQDLEPSTQYSITVSAFINPKDNGALSNEIVVITGPKISGFHKLRAPPPITSIDVACAGKNAVDVIWSSGESIGTGVIFYSFQYRKIIGGNRNHGTTDWNYTQIITNGRNWTRMNAPVSESNPTWYEVRIGTGFAFDNVTQQLTGEGSCTPQFSTIHPVPIHPDCATNDKSLLGNHIYFSSTPGTSTSTTTARTTSPTTTGVSTTGTTLWRTASGFPSMAWTTSSTTTTSGSTEPAAFSSTVATVTVTSTEPNQPQTTTGGQVFELPGPFVNNDLDRKTVNTGDGILINIGSGDPATNPSNGYESTENESIFSSDSTLIIVSVAISTVLLVVILILLVWRNSKQCRGFCIYSGNYYVDDPPRLPLLGSHNNGNIGWDGDGLGNATIITCPTSGGTNTKNSSQTNITMASNDDPQSQQHQQQQQQLKESVPIHLFPKHVTELHTDGDIGFSKEYEVIQNASLQNDQYTSEYSHHPENKLKNRYLNIVAYDHTLVRVPTNNSSSSSSGCGLGSMGNGLTSGGSNKKWTQGYINGNYIDGFQKPQCYIGTQGPLPSTFETFWNMIWEHNVTTIVMITNLIERGRKKCDMYWPREIGSTETYGLVQVRLKNEQVMATYTLRIFVVQHLKVKKKNMKKFMGKFGSNYNSAVLCNAATVSAERMVYHYHYTNWPDHGTPSHTLPVLSFVKKSSHCNDITNGGPIIVHCSAGVGRTGTYIVLDAMLKQINVRADVNVFGFLRHIRSQRNFLVQTEEQYIFIHDALLEAIQSGDTNVQQDTIAAYMNTLLSSTCVDEESGTVTTLLDYHFKLITDFQPKDFQTTASLKPCNASKIRNPEYICTDGYRVLLTPKAGIEGSDYINASFLPGYDKLHEFILTQHPLESTITSFWQMLSDHNVQTVVVLSAVDDDDFTVFWPTAENEDLELDTFRVKLLEESDRVGYVLRDLSIQSLADDDELNIKMIQSSHWPYHCASIEQSIFQLIDVVMESVRETASTTTSPQGHGPVVIVDKFGGREGATFCALTTVVKQMEFESSVDVYMYAKLYHEQRPRVWRTTEDYLYMYRSLAELTSGECLMKSDEEADEVASACASSSQSTSKAASTTGPPSPVTEPAMSSSNTPCRGIGMQKKEPGRDEVVVVVQIDNEVPESDQLQLPGVAPAKPDSPVSSNSSVVLCMSQNSPTSEKHTCEHILNPVQQRQITGATITLPLLAQQPSEVVRKVSDLDFMPTLSAARTPSPKEQAARSISAPSPSVTSGSDKAGKTNGLLRATQSPVAPKNPSPVKDQPLLIPSPVAPKNPSPVKDQPLLIPSPVAPKNSSPVKDQPLLIQSPVAGPPKTLSPLAQAPKSPVSPQTNGSEKGTTLRPTSEPILKSPSPKQGLSPILSKVTPIPSPTRSENDSSLMPPVVQTPSPLKYEKEPSLGSIPTPSPPPPPLPSSPPPPVTMEAGWDDAGANDPNLLTITPPPPPQSLLEDSPIRPSRSNGKSVSTTKSPSSSKVETDFIDDAANLPPPPTLTSNEEEGEKNGIAEQHEMSKLAQNGKQEDHTHAEASNGNSNGNGVRSLLLEEIKEEDEGISEERVLKVPAAPGKVQETENGNGHTAAQNSP